MKSTIPFLFLLCCIGAACTDYAPKPYGYFRVDLPRHAYKTFSADAPFTFEYAECADIKIVPDSLVYFAFNIVYPELNATIYCSYFPVTVSNLADAAEESRKLVYIHVQKAEEIIPTLFLNPEKKVYGLLYDLKGNVASPLQLILTDSVQHFFRGGLTFECVPNQDSLAPMIDYIREDIKRLADSFCWKEN